MSESDKHEGPKIDAPRHKCQFKADPKFPFSSNCLAKSQELTWQTMFLPGHFITKTRTKENNELNFPITDLIDAF